MRLFLVLLLTAPVLLSACSGQKALVAEQRRTIDSLYVIDRAMRADLYALQDSIQFFNDIDSGLYYRKQRQLEDRINRLDFLVTARADTLCAGEQVATLLVADLFEPASATLTDGGAERLAALVEQLAEVAPRQRLRVEGHSDNVPVGPSLQERYPSNWELSAARATSVVRHLVEVHNLDPARLEAVAFGDVRPVASNTTADGRRRNRRIVFLLQPD